MLITEEYRELNRELHAKGNYGLSGSKWATMVHDICLKREARSLLDYGAGRGTLKRALEANAPLPYMVLEYDPAIEGKETKPLRADIVVCGDVLEHVEPWCLPEVLDDIKNISRDTVFLVIATRPATKTLADGRNAHLIIERAQWWLPRLLDRWVPQAFRNAGGEFVFIGSAA